MSDEKVVYPEFSTSKTENPEVVKYTEDAEAKAFVDIQNGNLRYVEENDQWYDHNGNYWEEISKLTIIEAARVMNRETALTIKGDPEAEKANQQSPLCPTGRGIF